MQQKLDSDIVEALRSGDRSAATTLRMLKSALHNAQISKGDSLEEAEEVQVVRKEAKQRRESIESYEAGGRQEQAQAERHELEIIERYLPEELTEEELRQIVAEAISETGSTKPADIGSVMKIVQPKVAGRVDGGRVAGEVRSQLS